MPACTSRRTSKDIDRRQSPQDVPESSMMRDHESSSFWTEDEALLHRALTEHETSQRRHCPKWLKAAAIFAPYLIALTFASLWISEIIKPQPCRDPSQALYSPAESAIRYETKVFSENFETKGPYMGSEADGLPTDDTDGLWEGLYQFGISRIDAESAAQLPNRTTAIPTMPDQFVVELDVFHQLHCLNAIRKTLFPERYLDELDDYYTPDGARNYTSTSAKHFDHCIDSIRQSIMCHGDFVTVYWQWMPVRRQPLPRLEITHTCRNFDAIKNWAKEHQLLNNDAILHYKPGPKDSFALSG